ncbi:MAG: hypothetical protein V4671_30405 [Armatimonadota bacterium]
MASTAIERMVASMIGGNADLMASLDQVVSAAESESSGARFFDPVTVIRVRTDDRGAPLMVETEDGRSPETFVVWEGLGNLVKPGSTRIVPVGGGRDVVTNWEGHTPLDYLPETEDQFIISGYVHYVRDSNRGETNASMRVSYLIRKGDDNEGI